MLGLPCWTLNYFPMKLKIDSVSPARPINPKVLRQQQAMNCPGQVAGEAHWFGDTMKTARLTPMGTTMTLIYGKEAQRVQTMPTSINPAISSRPKRGPWYT